MNVAITTFLHPVFNNLQQLISFDHVVAIHDKLSLMFRSKELYEKTKCGHRVMSSDYPCF